MLYAKMLKETETEETRLFCHILIIGSISIGGGGGAGSLAPFLATPMQMAIFVTVTCDIIIQL